MSDPKLEILSNLGLTGNEAVVYLANLKLGPTSVIKISKETGLPRGSIYSVLGSLKYKGLISTQPKGAKHVFVAESPEHLEKLLQRKKVLLHSILPDLFSLYMDIDRRDTLIKHYQGIEGVKTAMDNLVKMYQSKDYYYVLTDQEKWYRMDPAFSKDYIERRKRLVSTVNMILQDNTFNRNYMQSQASRNEQIKLLPDEYEFDVDLVITPSCLTIIQTIQPLQALTIENQAIIEMCKQMFNFMWATLAKPSS